MCCIFIIGIVEDIYDLRVLRCVCVKSPLAVLNVTNGGSCVCVIRDRGVSVSVCHKLGAGFMGVFGQLLKSFTGFRLTA